MANEQLNNILTNIANDKIQTLSQLYEIQAKNAPSNVFLPYAHNTYDVDLNTRQIYGPAHLSVRRDHKAEVIYFKVDRYFDYMDLTNTICIIQYKIPDETIPRVYIVPFFDTTTCAKDNKILLPWVVGGAVTSKAGKVEYSIRFYRIEKESNEDIHLIYNLSTSPTSSEIIDSLEGDGEIMNAVYDTQIEEYLQGARWEDLIAQIMNIATTWTKL